MRKVIAGLDDEQRKALLVLADFGVACFSAGLVAELFRGLVSLLP